VALYHILILAVVQGITEFLPISSSGHLILTSQVLGWPDQGLIIDIATHIGTLFAVLLYFWRDILLMFSGLSRQFTGRSGPGTRLALYVVVATIPIFLVGYFSKDFIGSALRSVEVIAWATLVFGIMLWVADKFGMTLRTIEHLRWSGVLFIGFAQILALIPGTSRSGITMTAARILGLERLEAARISMLLSIPAILGAGVLSSCDLYQARDVVLGWDALIAAILSFLTAIITISALMQWLSRSSFTPFVVYRIALGTFLLYWVYS